MAYEDPESARPHPGDYMQMPEWLVKFSPSVELFAQDEVLFIMRNEPHYKAALDSVENDAVFIQIMQVPQPRPSPPHDSLLFLNFTQSNGDMIYHCSRCMSAAG